MTDDDDAILKSLGKHVREEREAPELPAGVRAFDDALADRLAAGVLGGDAKAVAKDVAKDDANDGAKVVRPARFRWAAAAAPIALAAAVVLFVTTRPRDATLPLYETSIVSAKIERSDPSAPPARDVVLDPNGDFELVARPASPASDVGARAVLVRDGAARAWSPPIDVSNEGAVRIAGSTRALFPDPTGSYDVVVLVAPRGSVPDDDESAKIATGAPAPDAVRTTRTRVTFRAPN